MRLFLPPYPSLPQPKNSCFSFLTLYVSYYYNIRFSGLSTFSGSSSFSRLSDSSSDRQKMTSELDSADQSILKNIKLCLHLCINNNNTLPITLFKSIILETSFELTLIFLIMIFSQRIRTALSILLITFHLHMCLKFNFSIAY